MENTAFIALSRQSTLRREMDVIANNLANMNTAGFKGEKMMFIDYLVRSKGGHGITGDKLAYVRDIATVRDFADGPLEQTGNPLDVALKDEGFFTVRTPEGDRYTRVGRFQLDETGQLVTYQGFPVLSDGGQPFFFSPEDKEISVARDGTISTENGTLGKLGVQNFENLNDLQEVAGGLYTSDQTPNTAETPNIVQYMVEGSNVQPIIEMTRMIEVNRSYASVKRMLEKEHERINTMFTKVSRPV